MGTHFLRRNSCLSSQSRDRVDFITCSKYRHLNQVMQSTIALFLQEGGYGLIRASVAFLGLFGKEFCWAPTWEDTHLKCAIMLCRKFEE